MNTIETTPSALTQAHDCQLAHHLRYVRKLRLADTKRSPTLASGSAVHYAVERWLYDNNGEVPTLNDLFSLGKEGLAQEYADRDAKDSAKLIKRYLPGVQRALSRVPDWLWKQQWISEANVEAEFSDDALCVKLHGRPDLYCRYTDSEGTDTLEIVDVKTTATNPLDYILWTPQIRFYAAMLRHHHPEPLIVYRYVCVPTGLSAKTPDPIAIVYTQKAHDRTVADILSYGRETFGDTPTYSRRCSWCPYSARCAVEVTGGDVAGIEKELYVDKGLTNVLDLEPSLETEIEGED